MEKVIIIVIAMIAIGCSELNATDDVINEKKSGFEIHTDYGTGCEYISNGNGLTPRRDIHGSQMGCRNKYTQKVYELKIDSHKLSQEIDKLK